MDRKAYIDKLAAQLKEWDDEITVLESKVQEVSSSVKEEYEQQLEDVKSKQNELNEKLSELRDTTSNAWDEIKNNVEYGVEEIKKSFKKAKTKSEETMSEH